MNDSSRDVVRQIGVISAAVFMLIAAMVGTGAFGGTPVQDLQDGALDADGSYLAPATQAFSIWSVIYTGLLAYTVWQALPSQRADGRQRSLGWWIALTMVLNGLWLLTAQFLTLPLTVLMIALLAALLAATFRRTVVVAPPRGFLDRALIDVVTGLHLGWVTLATVANTTAWLTQAGDESWARAASFWGVTVLMAVAVIGGAIPAISGRLSPALAMSWGLAWIAAGRLVYEPPSAVIGWTAAAVAVAILAAGLAFSVRATREGRSGKGRIGARSVAAARSVR